MNGLYKEHKLYFIFATTKKTPVSFELHYLPYVYETQSYSSLTSFNAT